MSLSKPSIPFQRCPANCRGCATFAALGGGYFPPQTPGGPLYQCYEYALAVGIIDGPCSSTIENEDLVPAPLAVPAKSARRPTGKPIAPSAFTSPPPPLLPFLWKTHQSGSSAGSTMSQIEKDAIFASSLSNMGVYEEKNATYPLGHSYLPPGVVPLPSDLLFTITTCGERCATSFVGMYAMRMRDAFQASGVDMRAHEVKGEWEKTGAKRWLYSLGMDKDKEKVNKILRKGKDVVMAQEKRGEAEFGLESSEPHLLPDKIVRRAVEKVVREHFDPIDWQGPDRDWLGADVSISTLPPRQRPLQSCGMDGLVSDDPDDESACTSFVQLKRTKPMHFKWYHRSNEFDKPKYEWPSN
ncbi:uncharacterized protein EAF02_003754 [Botrytis sinoallii]|uniref:uncharacterized protein n=1 Tax=Botrytis sinoallii TaxID=1463999 RepID=UPI0018FFAB63|nr:uncharacterized protein EAF02_003754 [Botrytis sinoallii]KAF7887107.1 hypothetical protein EAF02_003754 [Botrytis sinoallii]